MSFYRSLIVAVAVMGLATSVFAADENATTGAATETAAPAAADAGQPAADASQPAANNDAAAATADAGQSADAAKVDLNKATAKELMKVKGLSAAKARAIVSYRKQHGDFKAVEDLNQVKGFKKMNDKNLKKIEDQLTIG